MIRYAFTFVCIETFFISHTCDGAIPWVIHHKDEAKLVRRFLQEQAYKRSEIRRETELITQFLQKYIPERLKSLRAKVTNLFSTT